MASLHIYKSIDTARDMGAAAGNFDHVDLWELSKREILEAAFHLAALATDSYDNAIRDGAYGAAARLREEIATLRENKII